MSTINFEICITNENCIVENSTDEKDINKKMKFLSYFGVPFILPTCVYISEKEMFEKKLNFFFNMTYMFMKARDVTTSNTGISTISKSLNFEVNYHWRYKFFFCSKIEEYDCHSKTTFFSKIVATSILFFYILTIRNSTIARKIYNTFPSLAAIHFLLGNKGMHITNGNISYSDVTPQMYISDGMMDDHTYQYNLNIKEILDKCNLGAKNFEIIEPTRGDGNCFFRSIIYFLNLDQFPKSYLPNSIQHWLLNDNAHQTLRREALNFATNCTAPAIVTIKNIINNGAEPIPNCLLRCFNDFDHYQQYMLQDGKYADQYAIVITANYLKINIKIAQDPIVHHMPYCESNPSTPNVYTIYMRDSKHYQSAHPLPRFYNTLQNTITDPSSLSSPHSTTSHLQNNCFSSNVSPIPHSSNYDPSSTLQNKPSSPTRDGLQSNCSENTLTNSQDSSQDSSQNSSEDSYQF